MKVSIWQQFSGNHNSSFCVVGEFPTRADAERAAETIRGMLAKITEWHEQNQWDWNGRESSSPPEKEFTTQYHVEWETAIDWYHEAQIEIQLDRLVVMKSSNPLGRHTTGRPFHHIINRLGGKGYHDGRLNDGDNTDVAAFDVTCIAPNEEVAQQLQEKHNYEWDYQFVRRKGNHLHFDRWRLHEAFPELPDLIAELREQGCTEINYTFRQIPEGQYLFEDEE